MMIMAQHPQAQPQQCKSKQSQQQQQSTRPPQQYIETLEALQPEQVKNNQQDQDGKRTIIKNQLYLIEQLQLENANLRNERDQLQLENEELKFQLQMISSSNILNQPGTTFGNNQPLERLVEDGNGKINGDYHPPTSTTTKGNIPPIAPSASNQTQIKLLATPLRHPTSKGVNDESQQINSVKNDKTQISNSVRLSTAVSLNDCRRPDTILESSPLVVGNKLLAGKSTTLTPFNVRSSNAVPHNRDLPHDDEEQRVKLVEQLYGDSEKVQAAAIIIQRTFRKYQICKRFRTITEQLRHTCRTSNSQSDEKGINRPAAGTLQSTTITSKNSISDELPYASGTTRAAAWESLSYAASRLAAAAAAAKQQQESGLSKAIGLTRQPSNQQLSLVNQYSANQLHRSTSKPQDPVVAAAINFQQLESIRKRQYRVGLNIFNKNPEKGVSYLVAHSFIDSSSPYTKTSTSYYHSNQMHFIDSKQHLAQQLTLPSSNQSCHMCSEEDNLKRNVAHFLLHRKGLAKERIGQYLGNLQSNFNQDVLKYYLQELDFNGLQIDLALRKFLSTFRLPGEAQKIEKIVDCFAIRYVQCQQQQLNPNPSNGNIVQIPIIQSKSKPQQPSNQKLTTASNYKNNLILLSKDEIFILTFAIIMLNTDLHSPSLKPTSRMSSTQFVNNLRGVFKSQNINESDLIEIYDRVKANQITTTPDHVTHVMKVQQGLTVNNFQKKELPNLCVPYRRLVCFCRLFEVYDVNKKERVGQHQREIFLFNDLLLVTKLARRVRANTVQLYTYRQSISLQGLYVQLFQTAYYNFGIRLCQRSNDETLIMFNARNELDQSRFVDDLGESIAEMDEMETIKAQNIIDTIHSKYLDRLRRHSIMHNVNENNSATKNQLIDEENQQKDKMDMIKTCDTRNTNNKKIIGQNEGKQKQISVKQPSEYTIKTTAPALSIGCRVQAKFSSMLNLSSAATDTKGDNSNSVENQQRQCKSLRQNHSFLVQQQLLDPPDDKAPNEQQRQRQQQLPEAQLGQRRSSTSSVHSLDSGLFLSRDVSPNQSS